MNHTGFFRARFVLLAIMVALLGACATPRDTPAPVSGTSTTATPTRTPAQQAAKAYRAGRFDQAGAIYRQLADAASDENSSIAWRLRAAEAFALTGSKSRVSDQLLKLSGKRLSREQSAFVMVVRARLALTGKQPQQALRLLPRELQGLSKSMQARIGILRADAYQARGLYENSIVTRIQLDPLLEWAGDRAVNHRRIWRTLLAMPIRQINSPPPNLAPVAAQWWSLAAIVRNYAGSDLQRNDAVQQWAVRNPAHPASERIVPQLAKLKTRPAPDSGYVPGTASSIALMIPLTGALGSVGQSIQNGFVQAARGATGAPLQFHIYDTASRPDTVPQLYSQAVNRGADLIVGPLTKEGVSALAALGNLRVPVITLNTLAPGNWVPDKVFQFGLNPEAEAEQVARQATLDGRFRAAILHAQKPLDERLVAAFTEAFQGSGGEIVDSLSYPAGSNNLSAMVNSLLRTESARPLWKDVRGEGNSRADQQIDMIFVTGSPRDARLLRPMLRFHHAVDLPVYSTSQVYSQPNQFMDQDLDGLVFCDMPAVLGGGISGVVPVAAGGNVRLTSLGADAFLLASRLAELTSQRGTEVQGRTGRLRVLLDKRVARGLECAVFQEGRPQLLTAERSISQ